MAKTTNTTTAISNPLIHSPPDFLSLRFADFLILRASSPRSSRAALRGCITILMRRAVYIGENLERLRLRAALQPDRAGQEGLGNSCGSQLYREKSPRATDEDYPKACKSPRRRTVCAYRRTLDPHLKEAARFRGPAPGIRSVWQRGPEKGRR
jgi:hypothetical protein